MTTPAKRIFLCVNERRIGDSCGRRAKTGHFARLLKKLLAAHGLGDEVDLIKARCLGRCQQGPVLAYFPEKTWYTYHNEEDIAEIVTEHLVRGCPVTRLLTGGPQAERQPAVSSGQGRPA